MRHLLNHAPLLLPAAMLAAGTALGGWTGVPQWAWLAMLLTAIALLPLAIKREKTATVLILWGALALGAALSAQAEKSLRISLPKEKTKYEGILMSEPERRGKVMRFDIAILTGEKPIIAKASLLCDTTDNRHLRLHTGDGIRAASYLEEPSNFADSDFDYARWLLLHGYKAETFILPSDWQKARVATHELGLWGKAVVKARKLRQRVLHHYRRLGMEGDGAAVVAAMTTGDKSLISKTLKDDYSRSGAAHVLALSGLHLGILYGVFSLLGAGRRRKRWLPSLLALGAVWAFAFLTGLSPSVTRSATMISIYALAALPHRDPQPVNALMATIIIMLVARPLLIHDAAFQLSVLAVLSIQLFLPMLLRLLPREWRGRSRLLAWTWDFVAITVAAQLGTAPLVAHVFGQLSCYFLLTNLIAVPCTTVILYMAVVLALTSPLPLAQAWVAKATTIVAQLMNNGLQWVVALPHSTLENLHPTALQTALSYAIVGILWLIGTRISKILQRRNGY